VENLTVDDVYGSALYEAASELGKTGEFLDAAIGMRDTFRERPDLFLLLRAPSVAPGERKEIAARIFGDRVPPELMNFLCVLVDKRRLGQFDGIVSAFEKKANIAEGVSKGRIESATELTREQLERFEKETGRLLRRNVQLEPTVNSKLIGGVRVYVDGKFIDASIRHRLDELRENIVKGE
jgi:ATP synthase F1 delta subunit